MAEETFLHQSDVCRLFDYKDGKLYRKTSNNSNYPIGTVCGYFNKSHNRFLIRVSGKMYKMSQIIFFIIMDISLLL